jgi:hypothetical protein
MYTIWKRDPEGTKLSSFSRVWVGKEITSNLTEETLEASVARGVF